MKLYFLNSALFFTPDIKRCQNFQEVLLLSYQSTECFSHNPGMFNVFKTCFFLVCSFSRYMYIYCCFTISCFSSRNFCFQKQNSYKQSLERSQCSGDVLFRVSFESMSYVLESEMYSLFHCNKMLSQKLVLYWHRKAGRCSESSLLKGTFEDVIVWMTFRTFMHHQTKQTVLYFTTFRFYLSFSYIEKTVHCKLLHTLYT